MKSLCGRINLYWIERANNDSFGDVFVQDKIRLPNGFLRGSGPWGSVTHNPIHLWTQGLVLSGSISLQFLSLDGEDSSVDLSSISSLFTRLVFLIERLFRMVRLQVIGSKYH